MILIAHSHRMYTNNNNRVAKSAEKLSSGYRVNRAGDDAAGLAISEKMRAQIRGLNMAAKNSNDAISLVQTAEGALQEVQNMLQRMNELAVQSASDTNVTLDRNALQLEFEQLQDEIDQIAQTTKFNDTVLLDGSLGGGKSSGTYLMDGAGTGVTNDFLVSFAGGLSGTGVKLESVAGATAGATAAWDANGDLTVTVCGAKDTTVTAEMINEAISKATIPDGVDVASENKTIKYVGDDITFDKAASAAETLATDNITGYKDATTATKKVGGVDVSISAIGGGEKYNGDVVTFKDSDTSTKESIEIDNANGNITITLDKDKDYTADDINALIEEVGGKVEVAFDGKINAAEITADVAFTALDNGGGVEVEGSAYIQVGAEEGHTLNLSIESMNTTGLGITKAQANIATREAASAAITVSRAAINKISMQRAELGAMQNRLEYKVNNLSTTVENLQAAESRIRDVDMASEMSNFTKNNILVQASTAMLAQANSLPQNVLQLLG